MPSTLVCRFSVPVIALPAVAGFPERRVFALLKAVVQGHTAPVAVKRLLALLERCCCGAGRSRGVIPGAASFPGRRGGAAAPVSDDLSLRLPLVGWVLLLLSHALECCALLATSATKYDRDRRRRRCHRRRRCCT